MNKNLMKQLFTINCLILGYINNINAQFGSQYKSTLTFSVDYYNIKNPVFRDESNIPTFYSNYTGSDFILRENENHFGFMFGWKGVALNEDSKIKPGFGLAVKFSNYHIKVNDFLYEGAFGDTIFVENTKKGYYFLDLIISGEIKFISLYTLAGLGFENQRSSLGFESGYTEFNFCYGFGLEIKPIKYVTLFFEYRAIAGSGRWSCEEKDIHTTSSGATSYIIIGDCKGTSTEYKTSYPTKVLICGITYNFPLKKTK